MAKGQKKRKRLKDTLAYAYIRKIKKWMHCPACQNGKMTIDKKSTVWICEVCGYKLSADEFEDDYVFWFCDECNTYLNNQEGFDRKASKHICQKCGFENNITSDNIKGICSDCGKILPDPDATRCADCKILHMQKISETLLAIGKGLQDIANTIESPSPINNSYLPIECDCEEEFIKKCANCGNTDENTLWDEDDTIFCSRCCHRTSKETRQDDLVVCPYCHRMRDRKAMYCRWCNDSTWKASTQDEFEEIDKILKDMGY